MVDLYILDYLRDPLWQFVGVLITILTILVTIWIYKRQKNQKSLSYEILSESLLLRVEDELKGKVKILYEDKPVQKVHLIVLKTINSGNIPILTSDYETPITYTCGEDSQILSSEIIEKYPKDLTEIFSINEKYVQIQPKLMNSGDFFIMNLLVSKYEKPLKITGRIVGVKEIKAVEKNSFKTAFFIILGILLHCGLLVKTYR
jgi:hypothetical protein